MHAAQLLLTIDIESTVRTLRESITDPVVRSLSLVECAVWQMVNYDYGMYNQSFPRAYRQMIQAGALR